jgi:polyferredoxin
MAVPDINYLAVLVSAIASMVLGMIWYNPSVFGSTWMKLSKLSEKDMEKAKQGGMGWRYFLALVGSLVTAYVMAHFVDYLDAVDVSGGLQAGFWIWLGFVATVMLGSVLWENKGWKLYWLNAIYHLINLEIIGVILSVWH